MPVKLLATPCATPFGTYIEIKALLAFSLWQKWVDGGGVGAENRQENCYYYFLLSFLVRSLFS